MADPEVAERKRFCPSCGEPVGRSRDGRPGRTEGFCAQCGNRYSFTPKLQSGDLIAGQYEVAGCLAHGGLGWIYLAIDRNVADRWVVLKGLLNSGDTEALAAAEKERAYLAEIEHPDIVKIFNFVQHADDDTGEPMGYIVMEYVGGAALKDILAKVRTKDAEASLPLPQALAYALEVLRAFGYLHGRGLLFCDFKPDNAIQSEEQLKLIDLGAVIRMDDTESSVYGTVGYQAPEIAERGPSISSDLYTVGRTLAVLTFPFRGFTTTFATELPKREATPLLVEHESFDRLLRRACHPAPGARFADAAQMAEQVTGVLREVLSTADGIARPAISSLFTTERNAAGAAEAETAALAGAGPALAALSGAQAAAALPVPLVAGEDPAAPYLAGLASLGPAALAAALESAPLQTLEVTLTAARARIDLGQIAEAVELLDPLTVDGDWRTHWYLAAADLAAGNGPAARDRFDALYSLFPGETAPRLGLAMACELTGDLTSARNHYQSMWTRDIGQLSAAFGLARVLLAAGELSGAVASLHSVPQNSARYVTAQIAAIAALVRGADPQRVASESLRTSAEALTALHLDAVRHSRLAAQILTAAIPQASVQPGGLRLFDVEFTEPALRAELERTYRALARAATDRGTRHGLVDQANRVRPRTLV